ncbi:MAG: hypothetical protein HOH74_04545 [Gemmatimonadetes bacterium]|nr:hypothetical protein [Gemmatimonadota bacterium]
MQPERLYIFGGPASGKTCLAERLSAERGLPHIQLDALFWDNDSGRFDVRRDPAERDRLLAEAVSAERWIIDGVYWKWCGPVFDRAEQVICLDVPRWQRHWRLARRHIRRRLGKATSVERETLRGAFTTARWGHRWNEENLPLALAQFERHQVKVQMLRGGELVEMMACREPGHRR